MALSGIIYFASSGTQRANEDLCDLYKVVESALLASVCVIEGTHLSRPYLSFCLGIEEAGSMFRFRSSTGSFQLLRSRYAAGKDSVSVQAQDLH